MSGLPYQGGLNSYMFDLTKYNNSASSTLSTVGSLASFIPYIGPFLGAAANIGSQALQNSQQRRMYEDYMSPQARMQDMMEAGINPAAAAQGISGSSAPQMNAAAPTSAFSSLGEALGNSANTALTAQNIVAQTKNLEVQSKGQDLQNKMTEVELGLKPDMITAEIDEKKAHAAEMRQNVTNLEKQLDVYDQQIKTLKSEEDYNVAKEGQVAYDNRLKQAQTERERTAAALDKAKKELTEVEKEIQEKERDNYLTPEERITKEHEASVKASNEYDPEQRTKDELTKDFEEESAPLRKEIAELEKELDQYRKGIKKDNYFGTGRSVVEYKLKSAKNKLQNLTDNYHKDLRRYKNNKTISVGSHGISFTD